ncbi:MAG: septal ring lytic transglycosylase RlpA family lipoprotein [Acidobacteria bacterium]|nr:MAG: septal ring lytic transglycosylase RlpA family lipoprotein [Acidobacteriota bacterium]
MRQALVMTGCLGLALISCGEKRTVRAAVPPPVSGAEVGIASWYGHPYHGRAAASGEIYDMEKFTAAHRTLPFGTLVRVINLDNEKTVEVRINDRGPFAGDRIIDLSHAAAQAIGLIGPGLARVRLEVMQMPVAAAMVPGYYAVQVGAFQYRGNAERLRAEMEARYGAARLVLRPGDPPLWRVLVGRAASENDAGTLAGRIRAEQDGKLAQSFVVRDDLVESTI